MTHTRNTARNMGSAARIAQAFFILIVAFNPLFALADSNVNTNTNINTNTNTVTVNVGTSSAAGTDSATAQIPDTTDPLVHTDSTSTVPSSSDTTNTNTNINTNTNTIIVNVNSGTNTDGPNTTSTPSSLSTSTTTNTSTTNGNTNTNINTNTNTVVVNVGGNPQTPAHNGSVSICLMLADSSNSIATTSVGLPTGSFGITLGTTSDVFASSVFSHTWTAASFAPNHSIILSNHDADCVNVPDLDPQGTYYYSPVALSSGSAWNPALYNDELIGIVHTTADFFPYNTDIASNTYPIANSNSVINLDLTNGSRTFVLYDTYVHAQHPANTPPTITLIGANPFPINTGDTFTDPGATANDAEDGNLTSHIVVTGGPINTSVVGTTTLTYTVTDSGGLTASTTRTVVVSTPTITPISNSCVIANQVPGTIKIAILPNQETTTAAILSANGINLDTFNAQKSYQIWHVATTSTVTFKYLNGVATASNVFGYYREGSLGTFIPVFADGMGINTQYNTPLSTPGQTVSVTLQPGDYAFALNSEFNGVDSVWASERALSNGEAHIIAYDVASSTYAIAVEDLPLQNSDKDYNDFVGTVSFNCTNVVIPPANTPPTITLIGANPFPINTGDTFTDPGATANDAEDGNLTSHIIVTGSVATSTPGTYTLTYTVTDSGGLTASTTRTVVVSTPTNGGGGGNTGNTLNVCLAIERYTGTIATTSAFLAPGSFTLNIASTSDIASSTIDMPSWTTASFAPNRMFIGPANDAQCITYSNLPFGTYYYSQASTTGPAYIVSTSTTKYNDGAVTPVNSVFDFFPYSSSTPDADGVVVFDSAHTNQTIVVLQVATNTPPTITLIGNNPFNINAGDTFTDPGATANDAEDGDLTSHIVVTGTVDAHTPGTYALTYTVADSGGLTASTTRSVVVSNPNTGGGGGNGANANLAVTKTADKSTANVSDTVIYTITVVNNGPDTATGVHVTDALPSGLTFVTATSSIGAYSTTTNIWTVGDLLNGSSTSLTLSATINAGTEGQKITNTAVAGSNVADSNPADNTTTADVTVNGPATTGGGGGGGCSSNCGGGGNGPIVGTYGGGGNGPIAVTAPTAPTAPNACYYLYDYLHIGWNNNPVEVKKLQVFLRDLEGYTDVPVNGIYDAATVVGVNKFQVKYGNDILVPWDGTYNPSSFTYILTKKKVNEIYCQTAFPITAQEQSVIDAYRNFINDLNANGVQIVPPTEAQQNPAPVTNGEVGIGQTISDFFSNNLAIGGPNSTSTKLAFSNFATAILGFPWNWMKGIISPDQCVLGKEAYCKWIDVILGLLVIGIIYLIARNGSKKNKSIAEVNKDLDLK